jgi:DNA-binding transcriptional ArsR family regulator
MARPVAQPDVFTAIADPTRRRLVDLLGTADRNVSELAGHFAVSIAAISQHLRILRDVGLVVVEQAGRQRIYRLQPGALRDVHDWVAVYRRFWDERFDALEKHLKEKG